MEVLARYSIIALQMTLGLVPEVLDAVDMVSTQGKMPAVVDAFVMKFRDIQFVVSMPGIVVND